MLSYLAISARNIKNQQSSILTIILDHAYIHVQYLEHLKTFFYLSRHWFLMSHKTYSGVLGGICLVTHQEPMSGEIEESFEMFKILNMNIGMV